MAEQPQGDKTEAATPKKLEEARRNGQIARSPEIQTVSVLSAALLALSVSVPHVWSEFVRMCSYILGHLHQFEFTRGDVAVQFVGGLFFVGACCAPLLISTMAAGCLVGAIQSGFKLAAEAARPKWNKINPVEGFKRVFSWRQWIPALLAVTKIVVVVGLLYGTLQGIADDPIFYTVVDASTVAGYLGKSAQTLTGRLLAIMVVIAGFDYAYQRWRTEEDLKMTKQEVKDENKNAEGSPEMKAHRNKIANRPSKRKMLEAVPGADVIITNPTHYAVAIKYDPSMGAAPKVVAKGVRLFALKIKELAGEHRVPIKEDKPLARLMHRYCPVGEEIPAELFSAVAKILAGVYRSRKHGTPGIVE